MAIWRTAVVLIALAGTARADDIPIITLSDVGPDQDVPTHRSFYLVGDVSPAVEHVQAMVLRRGSPSLFGGPGASCHDLLADLHLDAATTTAADSEDEDELPVIEPRYDSGIHHAFEIAPRAAGEARRAPILVT